MADSGRVCRQNTCIVLLTRSNKQSIAAVPHANLYAICNFTCGEYFTVEERCLLPTQGASLAATFASADVFQRQPEGQKHFNPREVACILGQLTWAIIECEIEPMSDSGIFLQECEVRESHKPVSAGLGKTQAMVALDVDGVSAV